jgi:hypothetical protein
MPAHSGGSLADMPTWKIFLVVLSWVLLVLFLTSSDFTDKTLEHEKKYTEMDLGKETKDYIYGTAERWYVVAFEESGVYEALHRTMIPNEEEKANSKGMEHFGEGIFEWVEGRLDASMRIIYLYMTRVLQLWVWVPFIPILIFPMIYDGYKVREIKKTNFDFSSPLRNKSGFKIITILIILTLMLFATPIAITPMFFPFLLFAIGICLQVAVANLQKRL